IIGLENLLSLKVKIIRCDNETEFKNAYLNQFCGLKGIKREFSVLRTPLQNGIAERKNRTLIEAARTLLADLLLSIPLLAEAVNTACYKVWILVDIPYEKRAIGTKWVCRNKKDERGIVIRNKARLVTQGHTQEEGIDYEEVFDPVARIKAIRLFLAYASFMGFPVYQMDVKSAFLYGTIEEEVYVCQPPGFEDPEHPDKVYKVVKALYGLHQAPKAWKFRLSKGKSASTPIDAEKPLLKDSDGEDVDAEIYNIDSDHSLKVLSMQEDDTEVQEAVEIVTTAKLMTEVITAAATQVVAASTPIPAVKPKILSITAAPAVSTTRRKGVVIRDLEEELTSDTLVDTPKVKDKGKGILIEAPKPIKKKDQIEMDAEEEMEKEDEESIKSINETPAQKAAKRRKLSEEAQEADALRKRLENVQDEDDDVFVKAYSDRQQT
nr:copia protein [Tanacetum cinerariifolium]